MKNKKLGAILVLFALMVSFWGGMMPEASAWFAGSYSTYRSPYQRWYFFTRDLEFITSRPKNSAQATATPAPAVTPAPTRSAAAVTTAPLQTATPAPTRTAAPTPTKTASVSSNSYVQQMLNWINQDRAAEGLAPLTLDASLSAAALSHSQDMAQGQYCSHESPTRGGFSQRLKASGISTAGAGENVARYGNLEKAHAALMASTGHRANLMNKNYTHIGLGIVKDAKGVYYITQWTAKLR